MLAIILADTYFINLIAYFGFDFFICSFSLSHKLQNTSYGQIFGTK